MAHIDYPTDFLGQTVLLGNIIAQVALDGPDGPLVAMLASQNINLIKDNTACKTAITNNTLFLKAQKSGQNFCQQRNNLMKPIMKHLRGSFQFLKSLFQPEFKALGSWGATISDSSKITYPKGTQNRVDLFMLMKVKNDSYTITPSPLQPYITQNSINLGTDATNGGIALAKNDSFSQAQKKAQNYRQKRDKGWAKSLADMRSIGNFLVILFSNNTKALGEYGFVVVDEVPADKKRIIDMKMRERKLQVKVKIGSTLSNTGKTDFYIYKGKLIEGIFIVLAAGKSMIVGKGYSLFSVINASFTESGELTLIPK